MSDRKAEYLAALASESLSYEDIAYQQEQGWCPSSPDGMGAHIPDNTTKPLTCAECGTEIEPTVTTFWYVYVFGDVDPEARGPFDSDEARDAAAKAARDGEEYDDDGIYWLDVTDGVPTIGAYSGAFFEFDWPVDHAEGE